MTKYFLKNRRNFPTERRNKKGATFTQKFFRLISSLLSTSELEDEEDEIDAFFELRFEVDPMTKVVILSITDFAEDDEVDEAKRLWDQQISELKRVLGA